MRTTVFRRVVIDGGDIPPIDECYIGWSRLTLHQWQMLNYYLPAYRDNGNIFQTAKALDTTYRTVAQWLNLAKQTEIYEGNNNNE